MRGGKEAESLFPGKGKGFPTRWEPREKDLSPPLHPLYYEDEATMSEIES